jgi:predicted ATPase
MKAARAGDVWQKFLRRTGAQVTLESLTATNVRGLGTLTLTFGRPITAICGENGAGKTTVLKSLFAALLPEVAQQRRIIVRPSDPAQDCQVSASVTFRGPLAGEAGVRTVSDPHELSQYLAVAGDFPNVEYIDGALASQRIKYIIFNDQDFASALEGLPETVDNAEVLAIRKEITGRGYDEFISYEMDDYNDEPVFPYFKVRVGNVAYGSEDMGQGELCANYLLWSLMRTKTRSILLVEEPEAHLPPRAQIALMNNLAQIALDKKLSVVLSTHSAHTLAPIPNGSIVLLARLGVNLIHRADPSTSILFESLSIDVGKLKLLLTEDHSAAALLITCMLECDEELLTRCDIGWVGGESNIDGVLARFPNHLRKATVIGIYDGDQRGKPRPSAAFPTLYLPGDVDPVHQLVAAVRADFDGFAAQFVDPGAVKLAVALQGQTDEKDFFHHLEAALPGQAEMRALYRAAGITWIKNLQNAALAHEFVQTLRPLLIA